MLAEWKEKHLLQTFFGSVGLRHFDSAIAPRRILFAIRYKFGLITFRSYFAMFKQANNYCLRRLIKTSHHHNSSGMNLFLSINFFNPRSTSALDRSLPTADQNYASEIG